MLHRLQLSSLADHMLRGSAMRLQGHLPNIASPAYSGSASTVLPTPPPQVSDAGAVVLMELRIVQAAEALRDAGIRSLVLKGPSIGRWLYETTQARRYGDSDFLVAPGDILAAEKVIGALGYRHRGEALAGDRPWDAWYWMRPHDGAALDLHRTLTGVEVSPETAWMLLSGKTEVVKLRGVEVEFLNQPARTLHLALHAADHGISSDRPLVELAKGLDALPEDLWREAADLAVTLEATAAFSAGLRLLPEGAELAARLHLPANNSPEVSLRASPASRHALGLQWLLQTHGLGAKASLLVRKFAPPPAYMRAWSRLAQKGSLGLVLAYAWRPLYLVLEAPSTVQSWWRARRQLRNLAWPGDKF
ncbi:hypothetical protein BH20ACT21_BH20ACT21_17640 [soil metagenome]